MDAERQTSAPSLRRSQPKKTIRYVPTDWSEYESQLRLRCFLALARSSGLEIVKCSSDQSMHLLSAKFHVESTEALHNFSVNRRLTTNAQLESTPDPKRKSQKWIQKVEMLRKS